MPDPHPDRAAARRPRTPWWTRAAAAALLVGVGVTGSGLVVAERIAATQAETTTESLDRRTLAVEQAAAAEVSTYVSTLSLVASGLAATGEVDQTAFDAVTAPVEALGLGGATSLAFLVGPVLDTEVAEVEDQWRRRGAAGLELEPSDQVDEHLFSIFSRSLDGSAQRRTGIDAAVSGPVAVALAESRRSGEPAVSAAYELIIDQDLPAAERQRSFSLVVPVVVGDTHVGWALMGIRGQDFLGDVLHDASEGVVRTSLRAADAAGEPVTVAAAGPTPGEDVVTQRRELEVAQLVWTMDVAADRPTLLGRSAPRVHAVRAVSLVIGLLLTAVVWLLSSGRARAERRVVAATDELARSEVRAREQAALLDAVVATADSVGVSVVDERGTVLLHSPAARRILGTDGEGWRPDTLFLPDGRPFPAADLPLARALRCESSDGTEILVRGAARPEGVRIEVSGRPITLADGRRLALATFRDVTTERRQLAELAGFAGVVAHDLRTPLTIAQAFVELARTDDVPRLAEDADHLAATLGRLDRVGASLDRMGRLIGDLLTYATVREAATEPVRVPLRPLVEDVVVECLAARAPDAPTPLVHVGALPEVHGDPERLRQLLGNLVDNALKYVAAGARPVVDITAEQTHRGVRLRVADRGIGVPPEAVQDVFEPFARATEVRSGYPGTGLGLAICRRVVEAHGGELGVVANPGGGSVFVVDLPRAPDDDRAAAPGAAPGAAATGGRTVGEPSPGADAARFADAPPG